MADAPIVVYSTPERAPVLRQVLVAACRAVGTTVQLELLETGSLFRRLHGEHSQPHADLIVGNGPYMAQAAARDGFLDAHPPTQAVPDTGGAIWHDADWRWAAFELRPFVLVGSPPVTDVGDLDDPDVARLAMADPGRSEAGVMLQLLLLDRSRHGDRDDPWALWTTRAAQHRLLLRDRAETALAALGDGLVSHALVPGDVPSLPASATPLRGLAPLPNAIALVANAPHAAPARALLDWLLGPDAPASFSGYSTWHAAQDGLTAGFDLDWTFSQYRSVRQDWLSHGLSI
ncbi:MAG: substrate-binding domain-containing protein [Chloroflexi bacterium]|nr:substrate-binding domain-containing protein [Chloroflexota bacterium]